MREKIAGFDRRLTAAMQGRPEWLRPFIVFLNMFGSPYILTPLVFLIGITVMSGGDLLLGFILLAAFVAMTGSGLLKIALHRKRPDTPYARHMLSMSYSFPSWHAFSSALVYGLLACFSFMAWPDAWAILLSMTLLGLVIAVGYSRIYLGAHYVLDVLGGWLFAGVVLTLLVSVLEANNV